MKHCLIILALAAGLQTAQAQFAVVRAALPKVLVNGKVRVFYDIQGLHAVDATDANANQIPDQVEDIATQVQGAWMLLIDGLGFPDPFAGERFQGVPFLDIHLFSKDFLKSNGLTYDEIQNFHRPGDPEGTRSLCFDVATSVKAPANLTPAHELFHVIQNGVTYFKNRWYTEGTARWSERALGLGGVGEGLRRPWSISQGWAKLDAMAYEASALYWEPIALQLDPVGDIPPDRISPALKELKYVNGEPVLKDTKLNGWRSIRDILIELGKVDDEAYKERRLTRWSEAEQGSEANSIYIRRTVELVQGRMAIENRKSRPVPGEPGNRN